MSPHQHPGNSAGVTDETDTRVAFLAAVSLGTPVSWLAVDVAWFQIFNLRSLLAVTRLSASDTHTQKLAFGFYRWQKKTALFQSLQRGDISAWEYLDPDCGG